MLLCARAHAASPSLSIIQPRGAQAGKEIEITLHGARLFDAQEILYYHPGIETLEIKAEKDNLVKARIKIAADCRLGEHAFRLRTATGLTELRTFFVGALPVVPEKEPNSNFDSPQSIALNTTVSGVIDNEDVDYFVVEAKKGQRISVEIEAMRLGQAIFDPYIAILNARRFELAASDDHPLLRQDATCQILAPEDGKYVVQVRESAYGGNGNCQYRLHIGSFPRPTACFPAGGKPGEKIKVRFIGDVGPQMTQEILLPKNIDIYGIFSKDEGGISPSPNLLRVVDLDNILEIEPNNSHDQATVAKVPGAMNGIIQSSGDVDFFRFKAEKGQTFEVSLFSRRIRSPLDSVVNVYHWKGGNIAGNDDSVGPDSVFRFTAPESKEYSVRVRDHLQKGGPDYVYRLEIAPVKKRLGLSIPQVKQYSQERQVIAVPRGGRYAALISVRRENFGGDLEISAEGLPAGLKAECETMPSNISALPVLFEASADAAPGGSLASLIGKHVDEKTGIRGGYDQRVELVFGQPNNALYWSLPIDRLAVAVTKEAPFKIRIVEPKVPLVRNGTMSLRVVAERSEGFDAPISLEMVFNPPGVNSQRGQSIPKGKTEGRIQINARSNAQVRAWKIVVNGSAETGKGRVWSATQLATLNVTDPRLQLSLEKSSVEQGKNIEIFGKVQQLEPFEGKAKVRLFGLPHKVAAPEIEIDKDTKEFSFALTTAKESPAGRHRNLFCQVIIAENGEQMVHSTGGTELRIDKPLPPPKKPKPKPKPVVAKKVEKKPPAKKAPRRLTRLEKLRLEFKKSEEEAGGSRP